MDTRQLFGTVQRSTSFWGSFSPLASIHSVRRCPGLGARQSFNSGSDSDKNKATPCSAIFLIGQRSSHIARVAQWSGAHPDAPSALPGRRLPVKDSSGAVPEPHKVFDEVVIVVKSGRGGNGEIVPADRGRYVANHKYKPGGNQPKQIWLPASDPGDGADGGDVVLVCDPSVDSLLHLYQGGGKGGTPPGAVSPGAVAGTFCAPDGANANPNTGSGGPKRNKEIKKARTASLEIPVPPGTVVKRRGTGALLGELLQPGQRLTVVRGGQGGHGVVAPSRQQRQARISRAEREARSKGVELVDVEDDGWRTDSRGQTGQQLTLTLLLRVVADVGLVGFPNAGKSSLLKALTRASPTIAPYPFTTLMPNLGVMTAGGGASRAVLADLPGLIEGAHKGRGLGRNFLRHLRRTRALLHVVDASGPDPAVDYCAVREELRMYNPEYCSRPHVVALNKTDLLPPSEGPELEQQLQSQTRQGVSQLVSAVRDVARRQAVEHKAGSYDGPPPREPLAVVPCSAATGEGLKELAAALQRAIGASSISDPDFVRPAPDTLSAARDGPQALGSSAEGPDDDEAVATAAVTAAETSAPPSTTFPPYLSTPRGLPPPPPPGWDRDGDDDDDGIGRMGSYDDVAAELEDGELERLTAHCRELGLMDERGNFLTHGSVAARADPEDFDPEEAEASSLVTGSIRRIHDILDEQELSFLDEHTLAGAAPGDGAADDDEWVELSTLDEQTLAAVLEELARSGGGGDDGEDGGDDDETFLDVRNDFRLAPPTLPLEHEHHVCRHQPQEELEAEADSPAVPLPVGKERRQGGRKPHRQQYAGEEAEGEGVGGGEEEKEEEELVRMAPPEDPDARLINLSLEELLALEKDW